MGDPPMSRTELEARRQLSGHDFEVFFKTKIKPLEDEFERRRGPRLREFILRVLAALAAWSVLGGLGAWWMSSGADFGWWMLVFGLLFTGLLFAIWAGLPLFQQYGEMKTDVLPRLLSFFGDLRITWDAKLPLGQFAAFGILPRHNKSYMEDLLEGSYRGVPLRVAEISLKYSQRSGESEHTKEVFRGMLVELGLGNPAEGLTIVGTRGMFTDYFALPEDQGLQPGPSGDDFEIHASPGARPSVPADSRFLRRLGEVASLFDAKRLAVSQRDHRLLLLIDHNQDFFELSAVKRTDFRRAARVIAEQVQRIYTLIERLEVQGPEKPPAPVDARLQPVSTAPTKTSERAAYGGWGCLPLFALWIGGIAAFGFLFQGQMQGDDLFVLSSLGGTLGSMGLALSLRGIGKFSIGSLILAALLLGGAYWVLDEQRPDLFEFGTDAVSEEVER